MLPLNPCAHHVDERGMRSLPIIALSLLAAEAAAGPIRIEIAAEPASTELFVVSVYGRYADFHNGSSKRLKEVAVRAGERHFIPLGAMNPLWNMGVSVSTYHPQYVSARAESDKTPLLIRPVRFDAIAPRSWQSVLAAGDDFDNGGPGYLLGQVLGHFQLFLLSYLPVIDAVEGATDDGLRAHLPLFERLADLAMAESAAQRPAYLVANATPELQRNIRNQDHETRAEVREQLFQIREWLTLDRRDRVRVRRLQQHMRYARNVVEELMDASDRARVDAFLERYLGDRDAQREPESTTRWSNPNNGVEYRMSVGRPTGSCSQLRITADLTRIVAADLGDLTKQVDARLCRSESGHWRYAAS